jgi:Txe/YoeB family toxin of Txe-Axe toxin-antitoxin module
MSFILFQSKKSDKSKKKLKKSRSKDFMKELQELVNKLEEDPYAISEAYTGNLEGLRKVTFSNSPQMRIILAIYEKEYVDENSDEFEDLEIEQEIWDKSAGVVDILFIKTREDCTKEVYNKSKKDIQNILR